MVFPASEQAQHVGRAVQQPPSTPPRPERPSSETPWAPVRNRLTAEERQQAREALQDESRRAEEAKKQKTSP